jgi:hypothetical protein
MDQHIHQKKSPTFAQDKDQDAERLFSWTCSRKPCCDIGFGVHHFGDSVVCSCELTLAPNESIEVLVRVPLIVGSRHLGCSFLQRELEDETSLSILLRKVYDLQLGLKAQENSSSAHDSIGEIPLLIGTITSTTRKQDAHVTRTHFPRIV